MEKFKEKQLQDSAFISKQIPILFKGAMVRAIINTQRDRTSIDSTKPLKWQTRRVIKPQPSKNQFIAKLQETPGFWLCNPAPYFIDNVDGCIPIKEIHCPYGKIGDCLIVRETWAVKPSGISGSKPIIYAADYENPDYMKNVLGIDKWKPSIHMPWEHSRITLEVTGIRVEQLQDITPEDIRAEGIAVYKGNEIVEPVTTTDKAIYLDQWIRLWDSINKSTVFGWNVNPFVFVVEFKQLINSEKMQ